MKKVKIFALTAIMMAAGAVSVSAQEKVVTLDQLLKSQNQTQNTNQNKNTNATVNNNTNANASKQVYSSSSESLAGSFFSVYAQYNFAQMHDVEEYNGNKETDNESFSQVTLGCNMAIPIMGEVPIYVQPGVAVSYGWDSEKSGAHKVKSTLVGVKIPINLVYSLQLPNSPVSFDPYLGVYGRAFIIGTRKLEGHDSTNLFSKDDMGEDNAWNRFGFGGQLGLNVRYSNYFVGVEYALDFTNIYKHESHNYVSKGSINAFSINLGMCF
jgi:hypothetical protein